MKKKRQVVLTIKLETDLPLKTFSKGPIQQALDYVWGPGGGLPAPATGVLHVAKKKVAQPAK